MKNKGRKSAKQNKAIVRRIAAVCLAFCLLAGIVCIPSMAGAVEAGAASDGVTAAQEGSLPDAGDTEEPADGAEDGKTGTEDAAAGGDSSAEDGKASRDGDPADTLPAEQDGAASDDVSADAGADVKSFSAYRDAVITPAAVRTVWFDGTLGLGTTDSLVKGATNVSRTTNGNGRITLPTTAGTSSKYTLHGWYDIRTGNWYEPGATVTVNQDTVFYADWVQTNYDLSPSGSLVSNQPDTSSFVRTDVFDYNEIFNAQHGAVLDANPTFGMQSHSETWKDNGGSSFLFTNWYNQNLTSGNLRTIGFARDLQAQRNAYDSNAPRTITSGIVSSQSDTLIQDLFTTASAPGRNYLGQGNQLFQYDSTGATESRGFGEGYYYYDSDYNGADYNRNEQRFYVYRDPQYIQKQDRGWNGWTNGSRIPGFMPFESGTVKEKEDQTNYWFGMKTSIDFFLPDNVGSNGGACNRSAANKDMRFYFSGDDDVWVFVDDVLVLDLGGIHQRTAGDINFSTGVIQYYDVNNNVIKTDSTLLKQIQSGDHKLTIYYLERGSSESNCSIYFNLAPRYSIELTKADADDASKRLEGAEFSVYADADCTVPVMLWENEEAYKNQEPSSNVFRTGADGKITCYGLYANRTYYLKETSSPAGYPSISGQVITLQLDAAGNAKLVNTDSALATLSQNGSTQIDLHVSNKKPQETSIEVQKKWFDEDGTQIEGTQPVRVQLYRSAFPSGGGGTGGDPGTGNSVPVNITTQYFGSANGTNVDTAGLTQGDLSKSLIAVSGGKLQFTVDTLQSTGSSNYDSGIYSVTVNGKAVTPVSTSGRTTREFYIGGQWGQYLPTHAVYEIDPVNEAMLDIRVTMIGYLNYTGSTPLVSNSMTISAVATEPENTGGSGGDTPVVVPDVKPDDAVPVGDPVELNASNEWHKLWEHLPVTNENGDTWYYYIEELPVEGYSTSYAGNGVMNGTITVTNVRLRTISVKKLWQDAGGGDLTEGLPAAIRGTLVQTDQDSGQTKEIPFTLNESNGWSRLWRSDSSELGEEQGHRYVYTIREDSALEGFTVAYRNNDGISEGEITIVNTKEAERYVLPATGGMGTYLFTISGAALLAAALLLAIESRRKAGDAAKG